MNTDQFLENITKAKILVIGDIIVDHYIWGRVDRISPEAPIPTVLVNRKYSVLGGAGNVAANLAGLGCQVTLIGVSGNDAIGSELADLLEHENIMSFVPKIQSRTTTLKTRVLSQNQQLLRIDEENIDPVPVETQKIILDYLNKALLKHDAVVISDYGKGLIGKNLCQELIKKCKRLSVPVVVDPKGKEWSKYEGAQCITPNNKEFSEYINKSFTETDELKKRIQTACTDLKIENLLITRGAQGMLFVNQAGESEKIPAIAREVYDVSGAGDTVIAVLTLGVACGLSWIDAAKIANIAAGIVVGKIGTQPIQRDELENSMRDPSGVRQKVVSLKTAKTMVQSRRQAGQKIVFTNGCFDLLHTGHISLLQSAAKHGNCLIVGLNSDSSIRKIKGKNRPILNQTDRASILSALDCVDIVVIFEESTPLEMIKSLKPDTLVKGADYKSEDVVGHEMIESWGGDVVLVPIINQISTSEIERKIRGI